MDDVTSFAEAAESHLDDVYGYLVWFTGDRFAAEDLAGETFERALRLWHRFDPKRGLGAHLALPGRAHDRARPLPLREAPAAARAARGGAGALRGAAGRRPLARARGGARAAVGRRARGDRASRRARLRRPTAAGMLGISPTNCTTRLNRALGSSRRLSLSQPDLLTQLREARPLAPAELREHVASIAARPRRPPRRRHLAARAPVAVPVAAAVAGAAILLQGGCTTARPRPAQRRRPRRPRRPTRRRRRRRRPTPRSPAPSPDRVQRISMSLQLRVEEHAGRLRRHEAGGRDRPLARRLPSSLNVDAAGRTGYAHIVLRIPKEHVQQAVTRLSALGTIVGENVSIQDLQVQVDTTPGDQAARAAARLLAVAAADRGGAGAGRIVHGRRSRSSGAARPRRFARELRDAEPRADDPAGAGPVHQGTARSTGSGSPSGGSGSAPSTRRARRAAADPGRAPLARCARAVRRHRESEPLSRS